MQIGRGGEGAALRAAPSPPLLYFTGFVSLRAERSNLQAPSFTCFYWYIWKLNYNLKGQAVLGRMIPPEAVPLYNDLIGKSPYLSDTVMITAIDKEDVLSSSMVTDILSANPQAAKSEEIIVEVENRVDPLTDEQMSQVMEGLNETGGKEILEAQLAGHFLDQSYSLNNIIRYYESDSLSQNPIDSITLYLSNCDNIWARYQEAFFRNESFDSSGASVIMTTIPQEFDLSQDLQIEHQYFTQMIAMEQSSFSDGLSLLQSDSTQISELNNIKQSSDGIMKVYARNLLFGIQGFTDYTEPYLLPQPTLKESKIRWHKNPVTRHNSLKLYPNPADNYVIAEYFLKDKDLNCVVKLYNSSGQVMNEIQVTGGHGYFKLVTDTYPPGMYICKLMCGNDILDMVKLIIR